MAEPTRVVQLSRRKGSRREPGVVVVDRSSPWGNPFKVGPGCVATTSAEAVTLFEQWVTDDGELSARWIRDHVHELAGQTLGCWCPQDGPCHAQVLAKMADFESVVRDLAASSSCSVDEARRMATEVLDSFDA